MQVRVNLLKILVNIKLPDDIHLLKKGDITLATHYLLISLYSLKNPENFTAFRIFIIQIIYSKFIL